MNTTNNSICNCNRLFNEETKHPLVSVINLTKNYDKKMNANCYAIVIDSFACNEFHYGRKRCDFSDATIRFFPPNKDICINSDSNNGSILIFNPLIINCTPLGKRIDDFSFFNYNSETEALHLSAFESNIINNIIINIKEEIACGIDNFSKDIITNKIEQLLYYCQRYYKRQFITRHNDNNIIIDSLKVMLNHFFTKRHNCKFCKPDINKFLSENNLSNIYFNDVLRVETGKSYSDYINFYRIELSKEMLLDKKINIDDIANNLLFCSTSCFITLFTKITGISPEEYRKC